jgi:uncharacterized membrane protein
MIFLLIFAIGIVAGLRALTAPACVAWAAYLGWLHLHGTLLSFMSALVTVCIFSALALLELVVDQLPSTPSRTAPTGLIARILTGGLCGASLAVAGGQTLVLGALLGAAGGVAGAFGGYQVRTRLVKALKVRDLVIALAEDVLAIATGLFIVTRF